MSNLEVKMLIMQVDDINEGNWESSSPLLGHFLGCHFNLFFFLCKGHRWQKVQTLARISAKADVSKEDSSSALIPPLEVVARSKAVAEASPWDSCSAIVAREAPRPEKSVVGGRIGGERRKEITLGSPKA